MRLINLFTSHGSTAFRKTFLADQITFDPVNLRFSGAQLGELRTLTGGNNVTIQDALTVYVILIMTNVVCYIQIRLLTNVAFLIYLLLEVKFSTLY